MSNWLEYAERGEALKWPYPIRYDVENEVIADVLVLGGGTAGCWAAICAAKKGMKVAIVEKGATIHSGDIGAGVDHYRSPNPLSKISPEEFIGQAQWPNRPGGYVNGLYHYITGREGYDTLLEIEQIGGKIRDTEDEFKGAAFRDETTKFCFTADYENKLTFRIWGTTFKPAFYRECKRLGVAIYDRTQATSLLTEGGKPGARVVGATGLNIRTGEFTVFKAKATILCLSMPQRIWQFSSELAGYSTGGPLTDCGNGHAMAWRAGATLAGMEMAGVSIREGVGYPYPANGTGGGPSWERCTMIDANGKEIPYVDENGKILSVEERLNSGTKAQLIPDLYERILKGEFKLPLYADLTSMPEMWGKVTFGTMVGEEGKSDVPVVRTYTDAGFDPKKDCLQSYILLSGEMATKGAIGRKGVSNHRAFGEHGGIGGLVVDWDLRTNLEGLYAAGEQVFGGMGCRPGVAGGRYAGRKACDYAMKAKEPVINRAQVNAEKKRVYAPIKKDGGIEWKELNHGLTRVMQNYCGDLKSEELLKIGLLWLKDIEDNEIPKVYARNPHILGRTVDVLDIITCSEIIIHACLARKASSPWLNFQRLDHPEIDPPEWQKWVTVTQEPGEIKVGELPIDFWGSLAENYEVRNKDYQGWYNRVRK